jgi:hypothetical protein
MARAMEQRVAASTAMTTTRAAVDAAAREGATQ